MKRRAVLATASLIGTIGLSGCSSLSRGGDETSDYAEVTRWALPPSTSTDTLAGYELKTHSPVSMIDNEFITEQIISQLLPGPSLVQQVVDTTTIDLGIEVSTNGFASVEKYSVYKATFDRSSFLELTEDEGVEHLGTHSGFDIIDTSLWLLGIGDQFVVEIFTHFDSNPPTEAAEQIIDASSGQIEAIHDRRQDVSEVAERITPIDSSYLRLDEGTININNNSLEGVSARGLVSRYNGPTTETRMVIAHRREDDIDLDALNGIVGTFESDSIHRDVELQVDGPLAELTYRADTKDILPAG